MLAYLIARRSLLVCIFLFGIIFYDVIVEKYAYANTATNTQITNANDAAARQKALADAMKRKQIIERNGIADTLCRVVSIFTSDISRAVAAFMLVIVGIGTYFGKLNIGMLLSMSLGIAMFFGVISLIGMVAPFSRISEGCNCKTEILIGRDTNGAPIMAPTGLNSDCTEKKP